MASAKTVSAVRQQVSPATVLVGLLAAAFGIALLFGLTSCGPKQVEVPDLQYQLKADAEKKLTDAGLKLGKVTEKTDPDMKAGDIVLEQSKKAGDKVDEGSAIDVVVSTGPKLDEPAKVPDLKGMTPEEAENALSDVLLVPQPGASRYSDEVDPGRVCAQSVEANTTLMPLETVIYYTSLGKEKVAVPDVTGKPLTEARDILSKAGLGCDTTTAYSDTVAKDSVISQNVKKDEQVDKGTVVVLEVSLGVKPADQVAVPNIFTFNLSAAKSTLDSAGLKYTYTGDEDGTVIAMDPAPGTKVDQGSTVTFELKAAADPSEAEKQKLKALDVEKIVWEYGLGEYVSSTVIQYENGKWYLETVCKDTDGKEATFYIDSSSTVYKKDDKGNLKKIEK